VESRVHQVSSRAASPPDPLETEVTARWGAPVWTRSWPVESAPAQPWARGSGARRSAHQAAVLEWQSPDSGDRQARPAAGDRRLFSALPGYPHGMARRPASVALRAWAALRGPAVRGWGEPPRSRALANPAPEKLPARSCREGRLRARRRAPARRCGRRASPTCRGRASGLRSLSLSERARARPLPECGGPVGIVPATAGRRDQS